MQKNLKILALLEVNELWISCWT